MPPAADEHPQQGVDPRERETTDWRDRPEPMHSAETIAAASPRAQESDGQVSGGGATLELTAEAEGRYRFLDMLGQGGIGVVLRAFDGHVGREVAVKELRPEKAAKSGVAHHRFVDEARITAQLEHPGIVPVYEVGRRADGTVYYTMRCLRGVTLAEAMADTGLDDRLRLIPRLIGVCQAIAYAHSHGVIHRDLKPANVMLGDFGETLVLDWGLAKQRRDEGVTTILGAAPASASQRVGAMETMQGQVLGTPAYMAPEQARGDVAAMGPGTDVYALGAILYELLTGRPPFLGPTAWDIVRQQREVDPVAPAEREPGCPGELAAIAMRALHKEPERRYPDARAMVADLEAFEAGGLVAAHTYGTAELARRWLRRHWLKVAAITALIAAVAGAWFYRGWQDELRDRANEEARAAEVMRHVERIIERARTPHDPGWYDASAYKLIALKEADVERRLIAAVGDADPTVRRLAARALGGMGSVAAVDALVGRLAPGVEDDEDLVVEIIRALGVIGDPRADKAVYQARRSRKQWGYVWQNTAVAYEMIPPPEIPADKRDDANAWVDRGVALVEKKRMDEALKVYARAIELDPKLARARTNRGLAHRRMGRYRAAVADHTAALRVHPGFPWALINRGVAYRVQGRYELARADLQAVIDLDDKLLATAWRGLAIVARIRGRYDEARAALDRALDRQPRSTSSLKAFAALAIQGDGRLAEAMGWLNRALEIDPTYVAGLLQRAVVHLARGELQDARADLDRAVAALPSADHVLTLRAILRLRQGLRSAARADFDRQLELRGGEADSWVARAIFLHGVGGDWKAALADMDRAAALDARGRRVFYGLLRHVIARRLDARTADLSTLRPDGELPWADELLRLARGEADPAAVVDGIYLPEQRCLYRLVAPLWAQATGKGKALRPRVFPRAFANRPALPYEPACGLQRAIEGRTWRWFEAKRPAPHPPAAATVTDAPAGAMIAP